MSDPVNQAGSLSLHPLHTSVMLREVLAALNPQPHGVYVDGTFGVGGYTRAILNADKSSTVIAIDQDPDAIARGEPFLVEFPKRLNFVRGRFSHVADHVRSLSIDKVDGFVLDLGVSSPQLDQADRGFSFRQDGPLDMRMSQTGQSAADVVNTFGEEDLATIIYTLGDERKSRRVAKAIVQAREVSPILTTHQLATIVRPAVGFSEAHRIDPATRTFQALRIYVNDELGELDRALEASLSILKPGGRLVVVSFHSLEDRRVKEFMVRHSGRGVAVSRHIPIMGDVAPQELRPLTRKAVEPQADEISLNPRARSAKLRAAVRCGGAQ